MVELKAQHVTAEALQVLGSTTGSELRVVDLRIVKATDQSLDSLFARCPNLMSLKLYLGCDCLTEVVVESIVKHCPKLEKLYLEQLIDLSDLSLSHISSLLNLKELYLTDTWEASSTGLQSLIKANPNIEVLGFSSDLADITDVFKCIGIYCSRLRVFRCHPSNATHAAVIALLQGCHLLEECCIDEYSPDDRVLAVMAESCPRLRLAKFDVYNEPQYFTDQGLTALYRGCPDLTQLCVFNAPSITNTAILSIAEHCHKLASIDIAHTSHITSYAIGILLKANPHITSVSLTNCPLICDEVVPVAALHCPKLRHLTMKGCKKLMEGRLTSILSIRHSLETLSISDSDVSDSLVILLAQYCIRLKSVTLHNCPNITEQSVSMLLLKAKCLTRLSVTMCGLGANDVMSPYYTYNDTNNTNNIQECSAEFYRRHKKLWAYYSQH